MVSIRLSNEQLKGALRHAELNCGQGIGKMPSQIHDNDQRQQRMGVDQAVGQVAMCAVSKYLHGNTTTYFTTRFHRNQAPDQSDGGYDLGAVNIDVKGGLMRHSRDPENFMLLVRPHEVHPEWVYIHCLLYHPSENPIDWLEVHPKIYLTGWCTTEDLPPEPIDAGPLKGALGVPVPDLNPLPPLRYDWFPNGSQGEDSKLLGR